MKKIALLLIVFLTFSKGISQSVRLKEGCNPVYKYYIEEEGEFSKTKERYKNLSKPSLDSWLSQHLTEQFTTKELETLEKIPLIIKKRKNKRSNKRTLLNPITAPLYHKQKRKKNYKGDLVSLVSNSRVVRLPEKIIRNDIVFLTFVVNTDNIISRTSVNTGINDLNNKLREIFFKIPIEKLGLKKTNKAGLYTVQIFEYKEGIPFINASNLAIKSEEKTLWDNPNLITRNSPEDYNKICNIEKDLFKTLSKTNQNNFVSTLLKEKLSPTDLKKLEKLFLVSSYNLGFLLNPETDSITNNFNENLYSTFPYLLKNDVLSLYFSVNKSNKITDSYIYTGDRDLDIKLIEIFKSIPLEKLGFHKKKQPGDYQIQLLEYKNDIPFINASSIAIPVIEVITINDSPEEFNKKEIKKKALYNRLSQPSEVGVLANYLKKKLNNQDIETLKKAKLISKISLDTINKVDTNTSSPKNDIILSNGIITYRFKINKSNGKIHRKKYIKGFYTQKRGFKSPKNADAANNKTLNKFYEIPLNKLGLPKNPKPGSYSVQLLEYRDGIPFINASTIALREEKAILKKCTHLEKNGQKNKCLRTTVKNHVLSNISATNIAKQEQRGTIRIEVVFKVDLAGRVSKIESKAPNKEIEAEVDKTLKSFNPIFIPATKNNMPVESYYQKTSFSILIEDQ